MFTIKYILPNGSRRLVGGVSNLQEQTDIMKEAKKEGAKSIEIHKAVDGKIEVKTINF